MGRCGTDFADRNDGRPAEALSARGILYARARPEMAREAGQSPRFGPAVGVIQDGVSVSDPTGRQDSAATFLLPVPQARPQILPMVLGRPVFETDRSLKGLLQSRLVNPCNKPFENGRSFRVIGRDERLADFSACPAKEAWRRWPPVQPERVDFIGHCQCSRFVRRIPGNGETQKEQQPVPNPSGPPILGTRRLIHRAR